MQLASIPGLEDVTVSTPAPSQAAAATPAPGTAPPPASGAPQPTAEVCVVTNILNTVTLIIILIIIPSNVQYKM